jgi:hypothetical protein
MAQAGSLIWLVVGASLIGGDAGGGSARRVVGVDLPSSRVAVHASAAGCSVRVDRALNRHGDGHQAASAAM